MKNFLVTITRQTGLISLPVILFSLTLPHNAIAKGTQDIGGCINSLVGNGVSEAQAANACADALEPSELSACVGSIQGGTEIKAEDALSACYRVRRPQELASCVVSISGNLDQTKPTVALDNCRRSLLPLHYAECTLGLQNNIPKMSSMKAMETCISAEFFPSKLAPETTK
jgi:hypothetical protein